MHVTLNARLGRDAELKESNGRQFLSMSLPYDIEGDNGAKETEWISVSTAQTSLQQWLKQGKSLVVSGRLHIHRAPDGKRYFAIRNAVIDFAESDSKRLQEQSQPQQQAPMAAPAAGLSGTPDQIAAANQLYAAINQQVQPAQGGIDFKQYSTPRPQQAPQVAPPTNDLPF